MLERLVKPILKVWEEMNALNEQHKKLTLKKEKIEAEYENKIKPLETQLTKNAELTRVLAHKQLDARKKLSNQLKGMENDMVIVDIDGVLYGVFSQSATAMICKIQNTKDVEALVTINELEKTK